MKNIIPLVTAVLLGLAAVFAVSKTVKSNEKPEEKKKYVLIVTGEIMPGEFIQESRIGVKEIPESAAPKNSIDESNKSFVFNQRAKRKIARGDYILYSDIELDQSKSNTLGEGQWGVPVTFSDGVLLKMLQPGDDIAIIGTFVYRDRIKTEKNADAEAKVVEKTVTAVIYPRVSILEIRGNSVLLSLPPEQAIALTAIQRKAKLYPLLRKKKDDSALNRLDGGKFEDSALTDMIKGLQKIEIPLVPAGVKIKEAVR